MVGAVSLNRDLDMWLVLRSRRKSQAKAAAWYLEVVLLQVAWAGLRHVNFYVQIVWQAQ